ncbi:MAG: OprO/OprP family phosphate-selective porin [Allosphingosinicella sp.]|uniref:OprO/OprP family phosphate-selective porin n=1 Tax=Allosphingosinicella sp. TaxID=2823234 RepID=UPI00394DE227
MTNRKFALAGLFAATALAGVSPASAQSGGDVAGEIAALRAQVQALEARLAEMEARAAAEAAAPPAAPAPAQAAAAPPAPPAAPAPSWRGAPQFTAPGGWSFKPRGRLQFDVGHVESPAGVVDPGLGFANRVRRARLGVDGTVPGGFGYRFEVDVAGGSVEFTDAYLSYQASPNLGFTLGQHNAFESLERVTSANFTSFMERAAFTTAFGFERRVGLSATYSRGPLIAEAGVFTDDIAALADNNRGSGLGDENESIGVDARLVYAPKLGETQLHFGGSAHWRDQTGLAESNVTTRYRQRPFLRTTNVRFIGTPPLRVTQETHYGLETALIRGPFHAAGEIHWLDAETLAGAEHGFFGGYAEVGYFLTGETRGYRNGRFDRTRVARPLGSDGGFGALQVNLRYDHLDLNGGAGAMGGRQNAFLASLIWIPQDYVRFMLNYGHLRYDDATLLGAGGRRDYSVNVLGARAQVDF